MNMVKRRVLGIVSKIQQPPDSLKVIFECLEEITVHFSVRRSVIAEVKFWFELNDRFITSMTSTHYFGSYHNFCDS